MHNIPVFETERLILKAPTEANTSSYTKYFVDYNIIRHLNSAVPWPYPENGVIDFLQNNIFPKQGQDKWFWGIYLKENPNEIIGAIDLRREGKPEHRGFWLGHKFWGQGIMTEAVAPINDYAFTELGFDKLVFSNAKGNDRSRRVKEKTGAVLIGLEPAKFVDPQYTEHEIWEQTKENWLKLKK